MKRMSVLKGFVLAAMKRMANLPASQTVGNRGISGEEQWVVVCNDPAANARSLRCAGNAVATTKYSAVSFLPKALFEQFRRVANLYFLVVAAVSCTPVSPVSVAPQIGPLLLVVAFSLVREAVEDVRRTRSDHTLNARLVDVLRVQDRMWVRTQWRAVAVGDLVRVCDRQVFPADLLLLASSNAARVCYVSTADLDGETNLKIRRTCSSEQGQEQELVNSPAAAAALQGRVICDRPNSSLNAFCGTLVFPDGISSPVAASSEQLLLRGCSLRNTGCIVGVVIFAGWQTKVMMNASPVRRSKRSSLEGRLDRLVLLLCGLLLLLSVVGGIGYGYLLDPEVIYLRCSDTDLEDYLGRMDDYHNRSMAAVLSIFTFFMLLSPIIPISLYIALEVVRFAHCTYFISNDRRMYHKATSTPAVARTSNLCEDLGRIEYILTDKTGTLTCNLMEFFKCSIAGVVYGSGMTEVARAAGGDKRGGGGDVEDGQNGVGARDKGFSFKDPRLIGGAWRNEADPRACLSFFRCLAICHTVLPEGPEDPRSMTYQTASPDEAALVVAAKNFGFFFHQRGPTSIKVWEQHVEQVGMAQDVEYAILNVFEFDSTRKRQSVVCRHPDGKLVLYCKGADSVIFERMAAVGNQHQAATWEHLERFGADGLRTLCLAYRELDTQEYVSWNAMYLQAKAAGKLDQVADLMERNLLLLGCTAIEDKLQEGVPACIRTLVTAGIKLWMLTGDKTETAINVAYACGLLNNETRQLVVNAHAAGISKEGGLDKVVKKLLREALLEAQGSPNDPIALVIDGECLAFALEEGGREVLLALALRCRPVVCCRVSPLQKSLVTSLVREVAGKVTLSIGDGANDVGMIQAAHIGVGISGQEGLQAVMASDFAIAQFRFLADLLLVHGRWSYLRISKVISYFLYKNLTFALTQFWFNLHTLFSGQQLYDDWYVSLFNVLFTTFPVLVVGLLDKDVSTSTAKQHPQLYQAGIRNTFFTWKSLALWFTSAFYQSFILVYLPVATGTSAQTHEGFMFGMWDIGTLTFTCLITTVNLRLLMASSRLTIWHCIGAVASILSWIMFAMVYGSVKSWYDTWNVYGVIFILLGTWYFWLCLLLVTSIALAFDFLVQVVQRSFYPFDYHILQELVKFPDVVAAAKKRRSSEMRKSMALERRKSLEMRKSSVGQKRKMSIDIVRRRNTQDHGLDKGVNRTSALPWKTNPTQIQTTTVPGTETEHPMDTTGQRYYLGPAQQPNQDIHQGNTWPSSSSMVPGTGAMAEHPTDTTQQWYPGLSKKFMVVQQPNPYIHQGNLWSSMPFRPSDSRALDIMAPGAWQPVETTHQNFTTPYNNISNNIFHRAESTYPNNWIAPDAPVRGWQLGDGRQQNNLRSKASGSAYEMGQHGAPIEVLHRAQSSYVNQGIPSDAPGRGWQVDSIQQINVAPNVLSNEARKQGDAPHGLSQWANSFQPGYWIPCDARDETWQPADTSQADNLVGYDVPKGVWERVSTIHPSNWAPIDPYSVPWQESETSGSFNWVPGHAQSSDASQMTNRYSYASPDGVSQGPRTSHLNNWVSPYDAPSGELQKYDTRQANKMAFYGTSREPRHPDAMGAIHGPGSYHMEGGYPIHGIGSKQSGTNLDSEERRRRSMEIVRRSITRELENNDSVLETVGALRMRMGLDINTGLDVGMEIPVPELEKRFRSLEVAQRDIAGEMVGIRKSIHAARKSRTGLDMFYTNGHQENRSSTSITMSKNVKGGAMPVMSRRAQASVIKLLGQMTRRHSGFAFENPTFESSMGQDAGY